VKEVAAVNLTAQQADIPSTPIFTPTNGGMFRVSGYLALTRAATTSATLPALAVTWTDNDTNVAQSQQNLAPSIASNLVGRVAWSNPPTNSLVLNVKAGTAINFLTSGYASSGATAMQFAVHVRVEQI
jgi:hypothetical protein